MSKNVLVVSHSSRPEIQSFLAVAKKVFAEGGLVPFFAENSEVEFAAVVAIGGDGTLLKAAESSRKYDVPLFGINKGHIGFLTEVEPEQLENFVGQIAEGNFAVEKRNTVDVKIIFPDGSQTQDWALNEASILGSDRAHPAHIGVGIDGYGISTYGADGLIIATPSGSTAYSFSAGGPVVWPDVQALVISPLSAHGLFTRPMVVSPSSTIEVSVLPEQESHMEMWCDSTRHHLLQPGTQIEATRGSYSVKIGRVKDTPFSEKLVNKFSLPVSGWRGK